MPVIPNDLRLNFGEDPSVTTFENLAGRGDSVVNGVRYVSDPREEPTATSMGGGENQRGAGH